MRKKTDLARWRNNAVSPDLNGSCQTAGAHSPAPRDDADLGEMKNSVSASEKSAVLLYGQIFSKCVGSSALLAN